MQALYLNKEGLLYPHDSLTPILLKYIFQLFLLIFCVEDTNKVFMKFLDCEQLLMSMGISDETEHLKPLQVLLEKAYAITTINQEIIDLILLREGHKVINRYEYSFHSKSPCNGDDVLVVVVENSSTKDVDDIITEWRYTGKPLIKEKYPRDHFIDLKLDRYDDLVQKHNQYSKLLDEYKELFKDCTKSRIAVVDLLKNIELLHEAMLDIRGSTLNVVDPKKVSDAMKSLTEEMSKSFQSFKSKVPELHFDADFQGQMTEKMQKPGSMKLNTRDHNCYRIGTGPAILGGYHFYDLGKDLESRCELAVDDERIKLTRKDTVSDTWRLQTYNMKYHQWVGWRDLYFRNKKVKVAFDVKFARKPTGGHYGVKFLGKLVNDWVSQAPVDKWFHVELEEALPGFGDADHIILIFDGVSVDLELRDFQLFVPK